MIEKRGYERILWSVLVMISASSCSQNSIANDQKVMSAVETAGQIQREAKQSETKKVLSVEKSDKEDRIDKIAISQNAYSLKTGSIEWEDLRIQKLLPGYMIRPAIEPYLPAHFVALHHPKNRSKLYWGDKADLEAYFEKGISALKSAVICIDMSFDVAQINENDFSGEASDADLASAGIETFTRNKWKWGIHPVLSFSATMEGAEIHFAWIGLNYNGQVLCVGLIYPDEHAPSAEDLNMWTQFLKKTKPLEEYEFYKAHGQDLRKGLTLVNVYGSVLKVFAEKRIRDGKIQVSIKPADDSIACKCFDVDEGLMGGNWHFFEPILKIRSEIQVKSDANVISNDTITVLLKEVSEFSNVEADSQLVQRVYDNVCIFNFCERGTQDALQDEKPIYPSLKELSKKVI
jgi:hypothetical protein